MMRRLHLLLATLALLLATGMAQTVVAGEKDLDPACQAAIDYLDRWQTEAIEPAKESASSSLGVIRASTDWLLDNDPPELFAPIHATMLELNEFALTQMLGYAASPAAMEAPLTEIVERHLDDVHASYAACPVLEQAMLALDGEPAPATPTPETETETPLLVTGGAFLFLVACRVQRPL